MAENRSSIWIQVGKDGELELVISRELWNAMKEGVDEGEADFVRLSLARLDRSFAFKSMTFIAGGDQPPCQPVST